MNLYNNTLPLSPRDERQLYFVRSPSVSRRKNRSRRNIWFFSDGQRKKRRRKKIRSSIKIRAKSRSRQSERYLRFCFSVARGSSRVAGNFVLNGGRAIFTCRYYVATSQSIAVLRPVRAYRRDGENGDEGFSICPWRSSLFSIRIAIPFLVDGSVWEKRIRNRPFVAGSISVTSLTITISAYVVSIGGS